MITDHKPLVSIFGKDEEILSQKVQCITLKIHQHKIHIIYKPRPYLYTADWLLRRNHIENTDKEVAGLQLGINVIDAITDILICITVQDMQEAVLSNTNSKT